MTKAVKQKQSLSQLLFPAEMYNNVYGSVVICGYMFTENKPPVREIAATWNATVKSKGKKIKWTISDEKFIEKTLKYFGLVQPEYFPIAFVQSQVNCLFAPFINGEVLPLREDGFMPYTLSVGKVYPLSFNEGVKKC